MLFFSRMKSLLKNLFRKQRADQELDEELRGFVEMLAEEKTKAGLPLKEARRTAQLELGGLEQVKERVREARVGAWLGTLLQDVRFGLRMLRKNSGFTVVAVLTLALGIGANTAIFSVLNGVLLKPLPYPEPQQIVKVWNRAVNLGLPKNQLRFSAPEFSELERFNKTFSGVAATITAGFDISGDSAPVHVEGAQVSPSLFTILGIRPAVGRLFTPEEGQPGRDQVLLLGYGLWQRGFGADPQIIGRALQVNGRAVSVVGVLPKGFDYPSQTEMWQPLAFTPASLELAHRGEHGFEVVARLKPGVSLAQGREDMRAVAQSIISDAPDYPYGRFNYSIGLVPLLDETVGDFSTALWVLCGAVGLVLLIVCVNIASLLLMRASARSQELALRVALGAGHGRLIRQLLTESVVLAGIGGVAGLCLAPFALHGITLLGATGLPRLGDIQLDGRVLFFTVVVSIGTGLLFGLAPSLQVARSSPQEALKEGGHGSSESGGKGRLRRILIVCETALCVVLLVGACLLMRSFLHVLSIDLGFDADRVLTMRISLPPQKYGSDSQVRNFYNEVVSRIVQLPGVNAAGVTSTLPLTNRSISGTVTVDTQDVPPDQRAIEADWHAISPGYCEAMGFQLLQGRFFKTSDTDISDPVAIIDDTLAHNYFRMSDPIGQRIKIGGVQSKRPWLTIVGVIRHVRYQEVGAPSHIQVYWPEAQAPISAMSLAVRTSVDPLSLASTVARTIQSVDADRPLYEVRDMTQLRADWVSQRFLALLLVGSFAALALILAAVGIYGVVAYYVTRRSHEIGIRMALGAQACDVLRMVLVQGAGLTGAGVAVGVFVSLGVVHLMSSMLYSVSPYDPVSFVSGSAVLLSIALLACYIPARRATKLNPMVALRHE